jgi:glutamine amidotransferase
MLDYGAGNLAWVSKAFEEAGATLRVAGSAAELADAAAIVVPGVGHFDATAALDERWRAAVLDAARHGRPILGICLGMQWLFEGSEEAPAVPGLGLLEGRSARLTGDVKVPHVGWNTIEFEAGRPPLVSGLEPSAYAYFTHAYAAPVVTGVVATTVHGQRFASVVARRNVYGVQFHPEKSGRTGLQILRNFVDIAKGS